MDLIVKKKKYLVKQEISFLPSKKSTIIVTFALNLLNMLLFSITTKEIVVNDKNLLTHNKKKICSRKQSKYREDY
jgi:hypothetical protein